MPHLLARYRAFYGSFAWCHAQGKHGCHRCGLSCNNSRPRQARSSQSRCSEAERELFAAIQIVHKGIEAQRNDLAHGCYGSIRAIADALLWVETKHMTNWTISVWNKDANNARTGLEHDELARHMFVYKKTDLEAIFQEMQVIWQIIFDFIGYLRRPLQPSIAETADEIFLRLCNGPR